MSLHSALDVVLNPIPGVVGTANGKTYLGVRLRKILGADAVVRTRILNVIVAHSLYLGKRFVYAFLALKMISDGIELKTNLFHVFSPSA